LAFTKSINFDVGQQQAPESVGHAAASQRASASETHGQRTMPPKTK